MDFPGSVISVDGESNPDEVAEVLRETQRVHLALADSVVRCLNSVCFVFGSGLPADKVGRLNAAFDGLGESLGCWLNLGVGRAIAAVEESRRVAGSYEHIAAELVSLCGRRDDLAAQLSDAANSLELLRSQGDPFVALAGLLETVFHGQRSHLERLNEEIRALTARAVGVGSVPRKPAGLAT